MHKLVASKSTANCDRSFQHRAGFFSSVISRLFTDVVTSARVSPTGGRPGFSRWFRGLSEPCRRPARRPGVLSFSTCTHPTGCPAVPWSVQGERGHLSLVHGLGLGLQSPLCPDLSCPDLAQSKKRRQLRVGLMGATVNAP